MKEFRISSSQILTYLALRYAFWPALAVICLFFLSLALGIFVDLRWIVMAFIVVCFITPMGAAYLYFWHALKPATAYNTIPHTVRCESDALILRLRLTPDSREKDSGPGSQNDDEDGTRKKNRPENPPEEEYREIAIPLSDIAATEPYGNLTVLTIGPQASRGFIFLPETDICLPKGIARIE